MRHLITVVFIVLFIGIGCDKQDNSEQIIYQVPTAVDLGLSCLWADCNVGAISPEQFGGYYAWGELDSKDYYLLENYRFTLPGSTYEDQRFSKYVLIEEHGTVDNRRQLEKDDDIAHVKFGEGWRLPTFGEWQELAVNCVWTEVTRGKIKGCEVKSKINGNSIFLPLAGSRYGHDLGGGDGRNGYYWSSTLATSLISEDVDEPWYWAFPTHAGGEKPSYFFYCSNGLGGRHYGLPIRPVFSDNPGLIGPEKLTLSHNHLELRVGETFHLKATVEPVDSFDKEVIWESTNPSLLAVDNQGNLTAIKASKSGESPEIAATLQSNPGALDICSVYIHD